MPRFPHRTGRGVIDMACDTGGVGLCSCGEKRQPLNEAAGVLKQAKDSLAATLARTRLDEYPSSFEKRG